MTLADFARSIGVSPATARQWKRRGKIVARENAFALVGATVSDGSGIVGKVIAASRDSMTVQRESGGLVTFCGCRMQVCAICNPSAQATATDSAQDSRLCRREGEVGERHPESHRESCADTDKRLEDMSRIEVLEKDNRILSDAVDSLRDLTTEQGRKLSDLQRDNEIFQRFIDGLRDRVGALETSNAKLRADAIELYSAAGEYDKRITALESTDQNVDPPSVHWGA